MLTLGKSKRESAWVRWTAWLAYALVVSFVAYHHEPWCDEADGWLVARDTGLGEMLALMGAAGTPSLWYFVQLPFAKLGFPYPTQAVVHVAIAILAAGIFLFRSPFPLVIRLLFAFGFFMSFEYAVVARSYGLSALLLFTTAALWQPRVERPLLLGLSVALLANTNAHSFFISLAVLLVLFAEWLRERPLRFGRSAWPWLVGGIGALLALVQLIPPAHGQMTKILQIFGPGNLMRAVREAFGLPNQAWSIVLGIALLGTGAVALLDRRRAFSTFVLANAGLVYIYVFKYGGAIRHSGFLLLVFLFSLWLGANEAPSEWWPTRLRALVPGPSLRARFAQATSLLLVASLGLSCVTAVRFWYGDYKGYWSQGGLMAKYIRDHGLEQRVIAAQTPWSESVLPYFDELRFWYFGRREYGTHMKWDKAYMESTSVTPIEAVKRIAETFPNWRDSKQGVLLLLNHRFVEAETHGYRLLHETPGELFFMDCEKLRLYAPVPASAD